MPGDINYFMAKLTAEQMTPNKSNKISLSQLAIELYKTNNPDLSDRIKQSNTESLDSLWQKKGTGSRLVLAEVNEQILKTKEKVSVLGGICSIAKGDEPFLREKKGQWDINDLNNWIKSWYPRLDQVIDCVGVPPKGTGKVLYVCEDSIWGLKLAKWLDIPQEETIALLKKVHEEQGEACILNWFQAQGYRGEVKVVYTSDLEKSLEVGLSSWERIMKTKFRKKDRPGAKVELMYTPFWLDILGETEPAIIYEPVDHIQFDSYRYPETSNWEATNAFGDPNGYCDNLGYLGFFPSWSSEGATRNLSLEKVPNLANWDSFEIATPDLSFYISSLLTEEYIDYQYRETKNAIELRKYIGNVMRKIYSNGGTRNEKS